MLNQSCFSADFSETERITTEAFWNSSYHSWFSPETTLNIPEFCVFQFLSSPDFCNFSPGKLRYYAFWIIISYCFSANTRSFIFCETSAAKLKSYGFWELRSHYSAKKSYSLFADFLQVIPDLKLSGNLDLSLFSQISAGKLRSYLSWIYRNYCAMAKLDIVLSADFL